MATNYHTATYLLASLKRRGMLSASLESLTDTDFLTLMSEELRSYVVPWLLGVREEHLVTSSDTSVTAGTAAYDIPTRAIGGRLRDVLLSDSSGNYYSLPRLEPEWIEDYSAGGTGSPAGYYIQANKVVLVPTPAASGTLRLKYFRRPGRLVPTSECAKVVSYTPVGANTVITCDNVPTSFSSEYLDMIRGTPGFDTIKADAVAISVVTGASGTVTVNTALYMPSEDTLAIGDFICLANESPIPQVPVEVHPLVAERGLLRALESLGDPKSAVVKGACDSLEKRLEKVLVPRVPGSSRVIVNRHGPGMGSRRRGR